MYNNDRKTPHGTDRSKQWINNNNRDNRDNRKKSNGFNRSNGNNDEAMENPYADYFCKGNLGLLYTRHYYSGIDEKVLDGKQIKITIPNKPKPEKTDYQTIYYSSRNNNFIRQARNAALPTDGIIPGAERLPLKTSYPGLLTGIGISHGTGHKGEAKLGLAFDHTTGLPYIPGSSVKGLLRSAFPLQDEALAAKYDKKADGLDKKNKIDKAAELRAKANALRLQADKKRSLIAHLTGNIINADCVDDLERSVFDGVETDKNGKKRFIPVRDIFFDAFPTAMGKNGLIGTDFITPHKDDEFDDPKPIQFMRIEPGVTFTFEFRLRNSIKCGNILLDANQKKNLFLSILTTLGIGAKTNVGYGQLR